MGEQGSETLLFIQSRSSFVSLKCVAQTYLKNCLLLTEALDLNNWSSFSSKIKMKYFKYNKGQNGLAC